jgi:hypothetical protein
MPADAPDRRVRRPDRTAAGQQPEYTTLILAAKLVYYRYQAARFSGSSLFWAKRLPA